MKKWIKRMFILIVFVFLVLFLAITHSLGDWDLNFFSPSQDEVISMREIAKTEMAEEVLQIDGLLPSTFTKHHSSVLDFCKKGSRDWKTETNYESQCELRTSEVYGLNGDFDEEILKLDTLFESLNWENIGTYGSWSEKISNSRQKGNIVSVADLYLPHQEYSYKETKVSLDAIDKKADAVGIQLFLEEVMSSVDIMKIRMPSLEYTPLFEIYDTSDGDVTSVVNSLIEQYDYVVSLSFNKIYYEKLR